MSNAEAHYQVLLEENKRLTADNAKLLAVIDKALDEEYIPNEWLQAALEGQEQDDE